MFTETWTNEFSDVNGFQHYVLHRTAKSHNAKRDSGGIVIYLKRKLICDDTFIKHVDVSHLWLKLAGDGFGFMHDLYVCLAYVIPENSARQTLLE